MILALPIYTWGAAPENLKTRRQLAEMGLRPGGPEVARVEWFRQGTPRFARLYDVAQAVPKSPATSTQLAALAKARLKRQQCPVCGYALGHIPGRRFYPPTDCPQCCARQRQADRARATQRAQQALANPQAVILDTETTDLDGYLVQIAVLSGDGTVLLDTRLNPGAAISPDAQAIHGITAEMVAAAPRFQDMEAELQALLTDRPVWIYHADFDIGVLDREVERAHPRDRHAPGEWTPAWPSALHHYCAMELYAAWVGEWSDYYRNYRWQRLPGGDHTALGDCQATLAVLKAMATGGKPDAGFQTMGTDCQYCPTCARFVWVVGCNAAGQFICPDCGAVTQEQELPF